MELRRSWTGLEVALVTTRAGVARTLASRDHRLICHAGRPVRATWRYAGRTHHRLQSRGDLALVPAGLAGGAGAWEGAWADEADPAAAMLVIAVAPALLAEAAARAGLGDEPIELAPRFVLRDPKLEHLAWAFEAELRAAPPGGPPAEPLYGDSLGMAIAAHLVREYRVRAGAPRAAGGLTPRQLQRVTEHIEEHVDRRLALAELAAVAGVSASHFKALFKRSTGLPVHQYVVRRRVERARLLLLERPASIADVAAQTGFASQSHLARWMRRVAGVTPTEVRRGAGEP